MRPVRGLRASDVSGLSGAEGCAVGAGPLSETDSAAPELRLGRTRGAVAGFGAADAPTTGSFDVELTSGSGAGTVEGVSGGTCLIYQILGVSVCAHPRAPKPAE